MSLYSVPPAGRGGPSLLGRPRPVVLTAGPLSGLVMEVSLPASGPLPVHNSNKIPFLFIKLGPAPVVHSVWVPGLYLFDIRFPARKNLCARGGHLLSMWGGSGGRESRRSALRFLCGNERCGTRKPTSPNFRRRGETLLGHSFTSWHMAASPLEAFSSL